MPRSIAAPTRRCTCGSSDVRRRRAGHARAPRRRTTLRSSRFVSVVMGLSLVVAAATARAETAKEAYNRGLSLFSDRQYKEAADAFLAAYQLKPNARILFHV